LDTKDLILGLFFSDENNLVHDTLKFSEDLSEESKSELKMLSFKFLGPLFLTAAAVESNNWRIELIESTLSLHQMKLNQETDVIQSFFNLNSSMETEEGINTNLFALIGSPYTEDIKDIKDKMVNYIHPIINQGKIVNEKLKTEGFRFDHFVRDELKRGIDLIEYSLGSSRKMYWEEQQKYNCVALIERKNAEDLKISNLYTVDLNDPIRPQLLDHFPSFYVMSVLPDYYEKLIANTLKIFEKSSIFPNIRKITLRLKDKRVIYLEEFLVDSSNITRSYGVVLICAVDTFQDAQNLSFYKKNLRLMLDANKSLDEILPKINPHFVLEKWETVSDENLNKIQQQLDYR